MCSRDSDPTQYDAPMTFEEAIESVKTAFAMWESEFVVGPKEHAAHKEHLDETVATLRNARAEGYAAGLAAAREAPAPQKREYAPDEVRDAKRPAPEDKFTIGNQTRSQQEGPS